MHTWNLDLFACILCCKHNAPVLELCGADVGEEAAKVADILGEHRAAKLAAEQRAARLISEQKAAARELNLVTGETALMARLAEFEVKETMMDAKAAELAEGDVYCSWTCLTWQPE